MKKLLVCIMIMGMLLPNTGCGQKDEQVSLGGDEYVNSEGDTAGINIGYIIVDESYETVEEDGYQQVNIHVPIIKEIENLDIVDFYNEQLGKELLGYESGDKKIEVGDYYHLDYEIATMTEEMISVVFRGESYFDNRAYPNEFVYTYNIDVKTGDTVCFAENNNIEKIAELLMSGEKLELVESEKTKEMKIEDYMQVFQGYSKEEWIEKLKTADINIKVQDDKTFLKEDRIPSIYSYLKNDQTILAIEVNHPLGDYVEILLP